MSDKSLIRQLLGPATILCTLVVADSLLKAADG
jgi:hypothetical protein